MRNTLSLQVVPLVLLCFFASPSSGNNALNINTNTQNNKTVQIAITTWGSDFYFAIMSVMGAVSLTILGLSALKPRSDRVFFYLSAGLCMVACIAYFAMGSNLGWTPIDVEFLDNGGGIGRNREIFYARYIDWFVTTPMLLLDLCLTAGLPWPTILWTIALDEAMVVTGLIGALVKSRYKWGFYVFGCFAMFGVFYELAIVGRASALRLGRDVHRVFMLCGVLTLCIWLLYPIAWGLCEGGNVITPNDEAVFYGCLDFMAKPVFSLALIWGHWNIKPERLGLKIHDRLEEPVDGEKRNNGDAGDQTIHNNNNNNNTEAPNHEHSA